MTKKTLPNEIVTQSKVKADKKSDLPNSLTDPQAMLRLRKKRHLSGLMCPPMSVMAEELAQRKNQ